jgi:serine/threonine protein kinase
MNEFPRRFGSYVLLKPLARGGMGALYLALSSVNDDAKLCVIKTVLPHLADKEYLQRFRDEAKVVVRLSHHNLVPVFDSGQAAGVIYLAMDYVDGRDLRATWNRCAKKGVAFPVDVAAYIVKELARGLHYAHGFGDIKLVHRDVSPPNVLLSYAGEVKLTDFGLASSTLKLEKTAPGIIYGKVSYMSPEQARGETLDGRTDLYASGIILWELLTGRQLFPSGKAPGAPKDMQTSEELLRRVRSPDMVPPSRRAARVPSELDRIALKALAPDLKDRYANCEELRHELATYLARTAPSTDGTRVSNFLKDLYVEDMEADRREREKLIAEARQWYASGGVTISAPPPIPSGPSQPETAPLDPRDEEETGRGRTERGTMISGPAKHDRALNKRRTVPHAEEVEDSAGARSDAEDADGDDEHSTSVIGTVVGGRYFVRKLLGEGGMGRVYEAEHIDIGRRVALKILHPAYSQTPDLVERLRREARAASKISHPNVIDVTDSGTTPAGAFFFVMEFLQGIELGELIYREKKLDVRRTLHIGAQICRALQAAHEVNVIHRDLKPENVLVLTRDGKPDFIKVLDFGIAKSGNDDVNESQGGARRLTHPGMTMGTPEYMAPEQAAGKPAEPRTDVYAAGGLLYEMLTGKPPFEGDNFMEILHKKANSMPAPIGRDDVPPVLEELIFKAMAKEPAQRPRSMEELGRELNALGAVMFPGFNGAPPLPSEIDMPAFGVLGRLKGAAVAAPSGFYDGVRRMGRKQIAVVAGGAAVGLALVFLVFGVAGKRHKPQIVAVTPPPAALVAPPPPVPAPPAAAVVKAPEPAAASPEPQADEGEAEAQADEPDDKPEASRRETVAGRSKGGRASGGASAVAIADNKRMLEDGERLLRAERFNEARMIFAKLAKSKRDRGPALIGLAEIAFQEKNYGAAVRSAGQASEYGGGAKARVLLGDAHFRMAHYREAAKAYEEALKLDPNNPSAKSGLALANKRM